MRTHETIKTFNLEDSRLGGISGNSCNTDNIQVNEKLPKQDVNIF